jgi:flagellar hook-associated protein 2
VASAIDTRSIITQLMAIERRPQDNLRSRVLELKRAQTAWTQIGDKLKALKTASDALSGLNAAGRLMKVSSSDEALTARSTGQADATSASVEVISLAAAHSVVADDVFASSTAADGGRELEITVGGQTHSFTSSDGTIAGLARDVNAAGIGVSARVLQTSPGQYKLALTSTKTGADNAFTTGGTGWGGFTTARTGADASLRVDGVLVSRSTNVVNDVLDGVELTLKAPTSGAATVTVERDDDAIVSKVRTLVDAANSALNLLSTSAKSSQDTAGRGPLSGDSSVRRIADDIRSVIAGTIATPDGDQVLASELGVSLNRTGTLEFDEAKLRESLDADADRVLAALGKSATSDVSGVEVTGATAASPSGTLSVQVTQAASSASLVGVPVPPPPAGSTVNMTVLTPEGSFAVSFTTGNSWAETAFNLNAALISAGVQIQAETTQSGGVDDGLRLTEARFGSGRAFSVSGGASVGLDGTADDGDNAVVNVNGSTYTGTGRGVVANGLALNVSVTSTQLANAGGTLSGNLTVTNGLAGALGAIGAAGDRTSVVGEATDTLDRRIEDLEKRITRFDDVLAQRQLVLERRFAAMDTMIQRLSAIGGSLGLVPQAG